MPKHRDFLACMPKLENLINHKAKIITEIAWHQRTTVLRRIRCGFRGNSRIIWDYRLCSILIPTVFFDTRLWKTVHSRKHFQNFRQSRVLLTDRLEIHQSPLYSMTLRRLEGHTSGCNWWISIWSVNNTQDWRKIWKRFRWCFVFQSRVSTKTVVTLPGCRVSRDRQACFVNWFCSSYLHISTKKKRF